VQHTFWIYIEVNNKPRKYLVQHEVLNKNTEHFTVLGRHKTLVISSNRPLFKTIGLKDRKPDFKLIAGELKHHELLEKIIEAIDAIMRMKRDV
jgi:hypothetical protein